MPAVNRLRALANDFLLPLVLGALVLRALIPVGFMPGAGAGFSLTAMMCNAPATGGRTETLEIPGAAPVVHCEYCLAPLLGAPPVLDIAGAVSPVRVARVLPRDSMPMSHGPARSQSPRGPPLA